MAEDASAAAPTEVEAHTIACALLLVCGVSVDAITAHDPFRNVESAPASLRVTSLILVAILASPKIFGVNLVDQRVLTGGFLAVAAFAGNHTSSESLRLADGTFVVSMLLATTQIYKSGGIEAVSVRPDSVHDKPHRRQTVSGLCAAMLFYVGTRGLRAAFTLPQAAAAYAERFNVGGVTIEAAGYAHASLSVSVTLGFGHGAVVATAALIGLHDDARVKGSAAIAFQVGAAGVAVCIAALWALVASSEGVKALPVLYGGSACRGHSDTCPVAARARRFAIANENSGSLWIAGLSMVVFSFAAEKRFASKMHPMNSVWQREGFSIGVLLLCVAALAVVQFGRFSGSEWHVGVVALLSLIAAFTICVSDRFVGELMYATAMTYKQAVLVRTQGRAAVFQHLTHVSLCVLLGILWLHIWTRSAKYLIELRFDVMRESIVNKSLGVLATAGASLSFALFLASALLIASSNGTLPTEGAAMDDANEFVVAFAVDHFAPFFVFAPLYAAQSEVCLLRNAVRGFVWIGALVFDLLLYACVLIALQTSPPTLALVQLGPLAPAAATGLLAFAAAGFA